MAGIGSSAWRTPARVLGVVIVAVCLAFALKALGLIDATTLWSDELYSVGKSFQPRYGELMAMLREDTHPPLYYSLLWLWGQGFGQDAIQLRLFSWLAYALGGLVMVAQALALAPRNRQGQAAAVVALLAFCSPYPVRFALEGKGYALLVLLVACGWWWRRRCLPHGADAPAQGWRQVFPYTLFVAAAGLTHFYGLFVFAAAGVWDGWKRRWCLAFAALLGVLPASGWIVYASRYLLSSRSGSWISRPDFALLEETLARALGPWPLPKVVLVAVVVLLLWQRGRQHPASGAANLDHPGALSPGLCDRTGLIPSAWMVVAVVALSFFKPLAFSRYFVVLLPAVLPWIGVSLAGVRLKPLAGRVVVVLVVSTLVLWWHQSFLGLEGQGLGARESDQFRAISQLTAGAPERFSPRPRLMNLSDRMELAAGRLLADPSPWENGDVLTRRLERPSSDPLPSELWLAASGPDGVTRKRLRPLEQTAARRGYVCSPNSVQPAFSRLVRCRWPSIDGASPGEPAPRTQG